MSIKTLTEDMGRSRFEKNRGVDKKVGCVMPCLIYVMIIEKNHPMGNTIFAIRIKTATGLEKLYFT
jgi:hypothetical protein